MSTVWKWILGILGLLIVVGLVAGAVFMWQNHMTWWGPVSPRVTAPGAPPPQQGQTAPYGDRDYWRYHMGPRTWGMPMMHGYGVPYGYTPFGPGFMIVFGLFRLLIPLGILALVAYLFYQMGKRAGASTGPAAPSGPRPDAPTPPGRKVARG